MWQTHKTSIILGITFTALLSAFWLLPAFAFIFFISLLLDLLLDYPVRELSRYIPRGIAAGLVLTASMLFIIGIFTLITRSFLPTLTDFAASLPSIAADIQSLDILRDNEWLESGIHDAWDELSALSTSMIKSSLLVILGAFNKVIDFVIILFVTFYLLMDGDKIKDFVSNLFPGKDKQRIVKLMEQILSSLQVYIRSQLVMCCLTAFIVYAYFTIMGLPYASVFAVASGIGEFIPVLGPTVASCFGIIITATNSPFFIIQTAIFYLIMTQINHNFIYPAIVGKSLNLHPIAIILGIILGGELLDTAGMFLAVPCLVVFKHLIEDIHQSTKNV